MKYAARKTTQSTAKAALSGDPSRELRDLLAELLAEHVTLLRLLNEQREAIRRADAELLGSVAARHSRTLARISDLETNRRELVAAWPMAGIQPKGRARTLTEIAASLPEPGRSECLSLASQLRDMLASAQKASSVLRAASSSLMAHMEGLMRQVGRRLSHAGTYGRTGEVEPVASVVTALDLTR